MKGACLEFENPISDSISRLRFAPQSNNLLIASWDSILRLYDVDSSVARLEAPSEAGLLDCCFQDEFTAFTVGSDCCLRRYDFHSGSRIAVGNHDDLGTCVEYSAETRQVITAGLDKKVICWDTRIKSGVGYSKSVRAEVESISLCGFYLVVAIGPSINIYDLRNLDGPVREKESSMDYQIVCVRSFPNCKGYAVGSVDGRVALEFLNPSDASKMRYTFRCHPKTKDGRCYLVAVNDIGFHPLHFGAFVTGDNEGYGIMWDAQSRKRLFEFPRFSNSVASLSYNYGGQLLAVGSSYTYQEANEIQDLPQIFIHNMGENSGEVCSMWNSQ